MLRDYQTEALDQVRAHYRAGRRRVLLHLATGGGKTATFCELLKKAYEKSTPSLVAVRGRKLIDQASARLEREGVPHGIIMSGRDMGHHELVRVCSIDTLYRRRIAPPADFIVIDEAHQTGGEGYRWFLDQYPEAFLLPVTATPHLKRGLRHVADEVVYPISASELTARGFLVPLRYFAPETPNLEDISTSGDDYNGKELGEKMRETALSGGIVTHYQRLAAGKRALLFAVDVAHSRQLLGQLQAAGIPAAHVDANTPDAERAAAIARLERGEIKVLSNVGVLTTGVDIPACEAIIMARPTKSYNLWIQMIGRATRPCASIAKTQALILDHAGNVAAHGFLEHERPCMLDGAQKLSPPPVSQCGACCAWFPPTDAVKRDGKRHCPACGAELVAEERDAARRTEVDEAKELIEYLAEPWENELNQLIATAIKRNMKKGFVWHKIQEKYGDEIGKKAWQRLRKMPEWFNEEKRTQSSSMKSFFDSVPDPN